MKQFLKELSHDTTVDTIDWPESRMLEQELVSIRILDDQRNFKPALRYFFQLKFSQRYCKTTKAKLYSPRIPHANIPNRIIMFCLEL
jgi:hypothetical protein